MLGWWIFIEFGASSSECIHSKRTNIPSDCVDSSMLETAGTFDAVNFDFDAGIIDDSETNLVTRSSTSSTTLSDALYEDNLFLDFPMDELHPSHRTLSHTGSSSFDETTDVEEESSVRKAARLTEASALTAPKILKNDIRRSFSKMVFNTINCGDFEIMKEFTHTFMRPNCPFVCQVVDGPKYGLPEYLYTFGPRHHVHYKLGIFVMFPDLVGTMGESQIITSTGWPGTKIVIPFEFRMTQTYQLPTECWIPPENQLDRLYEEPSLEKMMSVLSIANGESTPSSESGDTCDLSGAKAGEKGSNFVFKNVTMKKKFKRKRRTKVEPSDTSQLIPASFVDSLYAGATPVAIPKLMVVKGQFNIFLDESHHVEKMSLMLVPQDSNT